jgi:phenylacetate-CoA ligase
MSLAQTLYPYAPVWAQNLGISAYGLAYRNERLGGDFDRLVEGFRQRERWSVGEMQEHVTARLQEVLCHAWDQTPYYQRKFAAAGIRRAELASMTPEGLDRLPTTPKGDLRSAPDDLVEGDVPKGRLRRYYSSGSTGTPVTCICTPEDHRRFIAAREARSFGWAGASISMPRSTIGGRLVVPGPNGPAPYYRYNLAERQVYFSAYHIRPAAVPSYLEGFRRHRPLLLTGYAYSHYILARMMLEQQTRLDYQPRALVLSSEKLTPEMKAVISQAFRARAFEEYGMVENCLLATECEAGSLHVSPDFGIVEIVDEMGRPARPDTPGRILATGLLNPTQQLIRYETGDVGAWSARPCSCGRNLPVLAEVVGRLEDVVIGPDGRQMVRFHGIFIGLKSVREGQLIQEEADRITVRVVAAPGFDQDQEQEICNRIRRQLGNVHVSVERTEDIPRTSRGKFKAVISNISKRQ